MGIETRSDKINCKHCGKELKYEVIKSHNWDEYERYEYSYKKVVDENAVSVDTFGEFLCRDCFNNIGEMSTNIIYNQSVDFLNVDLVEAEKELEKFYNKKKSDLKKVRKYIEEVNLILNEAKIIKNITNDKIKKIFKDCDIYQFLYNKIKIGYPFRGEDYFTIKTYLDKKRGAGK